MLWVFILKTPVVEPKDDKRIAAFIFNCNIPSPHEEKGWKHDQRVSLGNQNGKIKNPDILF